MARQPVVRHNDWGSLTPPTLGGWEPTLSVTVVVPTFNYQRTLPYVLAALAARDHARREIPQLEALSREQLEPVVVEPVTRGALEAFARDRDVAGVLRVQPRETDRLAAQLVDRLLAGVLLEEADGDQARDEAGKQDSREEERRQAEAE